MGILPVGRERMHTRATSDLSQLIVAGMAQELLKKVLKITGALGAAHSNREDQTSEQEKAKKS